MKKKNKRPFTLFLCVLLCGFISFGPIYFIKNKPKDDIDGIGNRENQWKGVITLWEYPRLDITNGTRYGWITKRIKQFEKENPGVYIELKPIDWKSGPIELETAIKTGVYPDIAPVATDFSIISKDILEPVDTYLSREELSEYKTQALSAVRFKGQTWGFPWMMTTYTMLLNLDIFNEKGIKPPRDGNWTYDEFVETAKTLTYDKDGDGKNDVFGFNSFIDLNSYNAWGILLSDGAEIFEEDSLDYRFNDKRAKSGLKKLVDLKLTHKVTPPDFGENSENQAWQNFYKDKKVAIYPVGTWAINVLENLKKQGEWFEYGVANYPIGEAGMPIALSNNVSAYGIFKQEDQKKLEMCVKFLKFITQDEFQKDLGRFGVFPVKKSAGDIYKNDRIMATIEKSLSYSKNIPAHPNWLTIDGILQSQVRQAVLGKKSIEEALRDAEEKIQTYNAMTMKN